MSSLCPECGLPVYAVIRGDGFTSCDCALCPHCNQAFGDCDCEDSYDDDGIEDPA